MDMKLRGMYTARQLSFTGVSFSVKEVQLPENFIEAYDASVELVRLHVHTDIHVPTCTVHVYVYVHVHVHVYVDVHYIVYNMYMDIQHIKFSCVVHAKIHVQCCRSK